MDKLHEKRKKLASYLQFILEDINKEMRNGLVEFITPVDENERGCQTSMLMLQKGRELFEALSKQGVIADWREPNVIRIAPVPLYNSFEDIWHFGDIISNTMHSVNN